MFLYKDISQLIFVQLKLNNLFGTPLFHFFKTNSIRLSVSANYEWKYIIKTILCFIYCLLQWIQIIYKIDSFKAPQIIIAVMVNGSITFHFVVLFVHFTKRHQIVHLFNHFTQFEITYYGNEQKLHKPNYSNLLINLI